MTLQPWEFLVLRDATRLRRLREVANDQAHVTDAAAAAVVLADLDPTAHAERAIADQLEKGYRADRAAADAALAAIERKTEHSRQRRRLWATKSAMLAATTLLYAAWDEGIASCPMGGFDAAALREAFDVGRRFDPVLLVTLGYPAEGAPDIERPRKFRRPVEEFVHFGTFDPRGEAESAGPTAVDALGEE